MVRLFLDDPTARSNNGGGDASTMSQVFVGGVDDRIDRLAGQVSLDDEHLGLACAPMSKDVHGLRLRVFGSGWPQVLPPVVDREGAASIYGLRFGSTRW
jgi:hypothetical protein